MQGMLFSQMRPAKEWEPDFHAWYNEHHIPVRLAIPGFASAVRYEEEKGDHFLAIYNLSDMAALTTPEYLDLKANPGEKTAWMLKNVTGFTRYTADLLSDTGEIPAPGPILFAVQFDVPAERTEEFDQWYEQEHIPLLMKANGWLRVRRYAARPDQAGPKTTRFALHEVASMETFAAPEREVARTTEWRKRLAKEEWFEKNHRGIYKQRFAFKR